MSHLKLQHILLIHPRNQTFRKRRRLARPVRPSHATELWYKSELLRLVRLLRASTAALLLPALKSSHAFQGDALPGSVQTAFERMASSFGNIRTTADRLSKLAVQRSLGVVDERLAASIRSSVGVDIRAAFTSDGAIRQAVQLATKANVELISSIPPEYFSKLRDTVSEYWQAGTHFEDLKAEINRIGDVTESRAKIIARDQTSKMNGAFNQARQTSVGIEEYEWQTSGDERVRETHAENDGKTFRWDTPPEETGHPGDDIMCRCVAIPKIDLDAMEQEAGL